jgi:hypothetical protein
MKRLPLQSHSLSGNNSPLSALRSYSLPMIRGVAEHLRGWKEMCCIPANGKVLLLLVCAIVAVYLQMDELVNLGPKMKYGLLSERNVETMLTRANIVE